MMRILALMWGAAWVKGLNLAADGCPSLRLVTHVPHKTCLNPFTLREAKTGLTILNIFF